MEQPPNPPPNPPPARRTRRGSETRQKQYRVTYRLNASEYAELQAAAERAGLTLASYTRACVVRTPQTRATRRPTVEVLALTPVLAKLGRVGGGVHQLVKLIRFVGPAEAGEIHAMRVMVREARDAIMAALGREASRAAS